MITELNEKALLTATNKAFRTAVVRKLNEIVRAVNTGVVWDNKVEADRKNVTTNERIDPIEEDVAYSKDEITSVQLAIVEMYEKQLDEEVAVDVNE